MRKVTLLVLVIGLGLLFFFMPARLGHASEVKEIPVSNVLVPQRGFDDNDSVELVVAGELPHACYTLGETRVEKKDGVLRVHQYAWTRTTGACAQDGEDLDSPVPFVTTFVLGRMAAADYEVQYAVRDAPHRRLLAAHKRFRVEPAARASIDDYPYAPVMAIRAPTIVRERGAVEVELIGMFGTSCNGFGPLKVVRQNDVFVVLPTQAGRADVPCRQEYREERRAVSLGTVEPGRYLIHVRSRNGKAVNHMLYVLPPS